MASSVVIVRNKQHEGRSRLIAPSVPTGMSCSTPAGGRTINPHVNCRCARPDQRLRPGERHGGERQMSCEVGISRTFALFTRSVYSDVRRPRLPYAAPCSWSHREPGQYPSSAVNSANCANSAMRDGAPVNRVARGTIPRMTLSSALSNPRSEFTLRPSVW